MMTEESLRDKVSNIRLDSQSDSNSGSSSGSGVVRSKSKTMSNVFVQSMIQEGNHLSVSDWTSSNPISKRQSQESIQDSKGSRNSSKLNSDRSGHKRKTSQIMNATRKDDMLIAQEYETDLFDMPNRERSNSEAVNKKQKLASQGNKKLASYDHLKVEDKNDKSPSGSRPSSAEFSMREGLQKRGLISDKVATDDLKRMSNNKMEQKLQKAMTFRTYALVPGEFVAHNRIIKRVPKSLYCLTNKMKLRRQALWLVEWKWFDRVIMACIIMNSVILAIYDFSEVNVQYNDNLGTIGFVFSFIFLAEALLKIIAQGFVLGKNTYLRSAWNVLDFVIVVAGSIEFILYVSNIDGGNVIQLKSLRMLRVLRPLKGLKTIPSLRKQVTALLESVLGLVQVGIFLLFIFILFGIMGLQWFGDSLYYSCRETYAPIAGSDVWEKSTDPRVQLDICTPEKAVILGLSGYTCPTGTYCGSPLEYKGFSLEADGVFQNAGIQFGYATFDNILQAVLAVFQIITLDSWTTILYNLTSTSFPLVPSVFCITLIFLGSFFLLNLMLAVIMEHYIQGEATQNQMVQEKLEQEKRELETRMEQSERMQKFNRLNTVLNERQKRLINLLGMKLKADVSNNTESLKKSNVISSEAGISSSLVHNKTITSGNGTQDKETNKEKEGIFQYSNSKDQTVDFHRKKGSMETVVSINEKLDKPEEGFTEPDDIINSSSNSLKKLLGSSQKVVDNIKKSAGVSEKVKINPVQRNSTQESAPPEMLLMKTELDDTKVNPSISSSNHDMRSSVKSDNLVISDDDLQQNNITAKGIQQELAIEPEKKPSSTSLDLQASKVNEQFDSGTKTAPGSPSPSQALGLKSILAKQGRNVGSFDKMRTEHEKLGRVSFDEEENAIASQEFKLDKTQFSAELQTNKMFQNLTMAMHGSFMTKRKELAALNKRAQTFKDEAQKEVLTNVTTKVAMAVQLETLEDKIQARDQIHNESNIMMNQLKMAVRKKFFDNKRETYGFKDEKSLDSLRTQISGALSQFRAQKVQKKKSKRSRGLSSSHGRSGSAAGSNKMLGSAAGSRVGSKRRSESSINMSNQSSFMKSVASDKESEKPPSLADFLAKSAKEKALKMHAEAKDGKGNKQEGKAPPSPLASVLLAVQQKKLAEQNRVTSPLRENRPSVLNMFQRKPVDTEALKKGHVMDSISDDNDESGHQTSNPLAAVFALAAKKRAEENGELASDDEGEKMKLSKDKEVQMIYNIKNAFEADFAQREMMQKMAMGLRQQAMQRQQMQDIIQEAEDILEQDIVESRAQANCVYYRCLRITQSQWFTAIIALCIIGNTIVLALDQYPIEVETTQFIELSNTIFYIVFLLEMFLKFLGFGFVMYFKDKANAFDFFVIVVSTVDLLLSILGSNVSGSEAIQALRVFRLLRVFKLAKVWRSFNYILVTIGNTLSKISSFSVLLYLFMFTYTVLGMELFSYKLSFDQDNKPIENPFDDMNNIQGKRPSSNFDSFLDSTLSVFIVLANDGWSTIFFDHQRVIGGVAPYIFFISLLVVGQHILFQLFLAILLQEFDERSLVKEAQDKSEKNQIAVWEQIKQQVRSVWFKFFGKSGKRRSLKDYQMAMAKAQPRADGEAPALSDLNENESVQDGSGVDDQQGGSPFVQRSMSDGSSNDKSLYLFAEDNCFRQTLVSVVKANWFENFILFLIVISSIQLALENPLNDPDGQLAKVLSIMDYCFTGVFTLEVLLKVVAFGFVLNGADSYLRQTWNMLDFLIVLTSLTSVFIDDSFSVFKVIRLARLLRPIRIISKNDGLKISIQALIVSVPAILNLLVIVILFMLIFGIIGVNLFKGMFHYCDTDAVVGLSHDHIKELIVTKHDCLNFGGEWMRYHTHFDEISDSMLQMISMSQTVGWATIMYRAMDSNGPDMVPGYKQKPYYSLFFVFYIIFGAFFITNLFVGVVISSFNRESDRLGKHFLLTDQQKKWIETKLLVVRINPKLANKRPAKNRCRQLMFDIAMHNYFDLFIMGCIALNTAVLALKWTNMSQEVIQITEYLNYFFTAIFLIEFLIKFAGYGKRYFRDGWQVFDFVIVLGSVAFLMASLFFDFEISTSAQVVRALRIGRMLRLFRSMKQLQVIFTTFMTTLPSLMNVGGLMFLIVYIYAVIGMNMFAQIAMKPPMHLFLNFQSVPNAILTLLRMATGENWNDLMDAIGRPYTIQNQCDSQPTYEKYKANNYQPVGCGDYTSTYIFFSSYILLVSMIFLNLFIAIILNGYFQTADSEKQVLNSTILERFRDAWASLDPDATGFIEVQDFSQLMFKVGPPLGWDQSYKDRPTKQAIFFKMISTNMHTYDNHRRLFFSDVLDNITLFFVIQREVKSAMHDQNIVSENEESSSSESDMEQSYFSEDEGSSPSNSQKSLPKITKKSVSSSSDSGNDAPDFQGSPVVASKSKMKSSAITMPSVKDQGLTQVKGPKDRHKSGLLKQDNIVEKKVRLSKYERKLLEQAEHFKTAEQMQDVDLVRNLKKKEDKKLKKTRNQVDSRRPSMSVDLSELISGKLSADTFNQIHSNEEDDGKEKEKSKRSGFSFLGRLSNAGKSRQSLSFTSASPFSFNSSKSQEDMKEEVNQLQKSAPRSSKTTIQPETKFAGVIAEERSSSSDEESKEEVDNKRPSLMETGRKNTINKMEDELDQMWNDNQSEHPIQSNKSNLSKTSKEKEQDQADQVTTQHLMTRNLGLTQKMPTLITQTINEENEDDEQDVDEQVEAELKRASQKSTPMASPKTAVIQKQKQILSNQTSRVQSSSIRSEQMDELIQNELDNMKDNPSKLSISNNSIDANMIIKQELVLADDMIKEINLEKVLRTDSSVSRKSAHQPHFESD